MTGSKTPGFYWACRGRGMPPIVIEVYDVFGELWVKFMGSHYILHLAETEKTYEFLQRIPEPEPLTRERDADRRSSWNAH